MTDINTSNSSNTTNKSKKELKEEQREKVYAQKLEANRVKKLAKLEAKKSQLTEKLNKEANPKRKGSYQEKIDELDIEIAELKDPVKASAKRPFGLVMRTWSMGLRKEAGRVSWHKKQDVVKNFVTIVLVCIFLVIIFFAIDMIVIAMQTH